METVSTFCSEATWCVCLRSLGKQKTWAHQTALWGERAATGQLLTVWTLGPRIKSPETKEPISVIASPESLQRLCLSEAASAFIAGYPLLTELSNAEEAEVVPCKDLQNLYREEASFLLNWTVLLAPPHWTVTRVAYISARPIQSILKSIFDVLSTNSWVRGCSTAYTSVEEKQVSTALSVSVSTQNLPWLSLVQPRWLLAQKQRFPQSLIFRQHSGYDWHQSLILWFKPCPQHSLLNDLGLLEVSMVFTSVNEREW